ncbi:MAG: DUF883 family protein [Undibacterium sp.]|nr:DUF883 family protein [Opitutaceae bacterium]
MTSAFETPPYAGQPKDADALIANISKLMVEAEEMLSESTSQHAEEKVELLRTRYEDAENRLAARYAAAKGKVAAVARRTDQTIRAYPYEAATVALGLGVLLGVCFFGRRNK